MNVPQFTIRVEPDRKLLSVTMRGFWDASTINDYDREVTKAANGMAASGCPLNRLLVLVDAREVGVQAQDYVAAYKDRFDAPERMPHRLATVVSSALFKRQVARIAIGNQRVFDNRDDALHWLFS